MLVWIEKEQQPGETAEEQKFNTIAQSEVPLLTFRFSSVQKTSMKENTP